MHVRCRRRRNRVSAGYQQSLGRARPSRTPFQLGRMPLLPNDFQNGFINDMNEGRFATLRQILSREYDHVLPSTTRKLQLLLDANSALPFPALFCGPTLGGSFHRLFKRLPFLDCSVTFFQRRKSEPIIFHPVPKRFPRQQASSRKHGCAKHKTLSPSSLSRHKNRDNPPKQEKPCCLRSGVCDHSQGQAQKSRHQPKSANHVQIVARRLFINHAKQLFSGGRRRAVAIQHGVEPFGGTRKILGHLCSFRVAFQLAFNGRELLFRSSGR